MRKKYRGREADGEFRVEEQGNEEGKEGEEDERGKEEEGGRGS